MPYYSPRCCQLGHDCAVRGVYQVTQKWEPKQPSTPKASEEKGEEITPSNDIHVVLSGNEARWVAATKVVKPQIILESRGVQTPCSNFLMVGMGRNYWTIT